MLAKRLLSDAKNLPKDEAMRNFGVACYEGYYENVYRLVFPFEDHYSSTSPPTLLTIWPCGKVEEKQLEPKKEKGLLAYGHPQEIDATIAKDLTNTYGNDAVSPFIWPRDDRTFGLLHIWTTNYNEEWKNNFQVFEDNPNQGKFQQQVVNDFNEAMVRLFGDKARSQRAKFAILSKKNDKPVYVGRGDQLKKLLESRADVRDSLGIVEVSDDSFTTRITTEKVFKKQKKFPMSMSETYVLYTKQGWETMACIKTLEHFQNEAAFVLQRGVRPKIPPCLLAAPLPHWAYHVDVARLFFNDPELVPAGVPDIPRPIPLECCVGPALQWAFWRALILWSTVGSTTVFGICFADNDVSYAVFKHFHRFYFFLAILFGFWAEWQCVKYFIVPFVERVQGCSIPMLGLRSFSLWLPLLLTESFFSMLSIQTNAEFMLAVIKKVHGGTRQVTLWKYLMASSIFGSMGIDWEFVTPATLVSLLWVVSTMQLFLPLLEFVHVGGTLPKLRVMYVASSDSDRLSWETWPHKLGTRQAKIRPDEALFELAYAGGMATIGDGAYSYPLGYMRDALKRKRLKESLKFLHLAQKQALRRLVIDAFVKKTLQLKIQVTLYALNRSMLGTSDVDWTELCPILLTLSTGLMSHIDIVCRCLKEHHNLLKQIESSGQKLDVDDTEIACTLKVNSIRIAFCSILVSLGVGYSCLQLMNLHSCSTSLWNLRGCVTEVDIDRTASGHYFHV